MSDAQLDYFILNIKTKENHHDLVKKMCVGLFGDT